MRHTAHTFVAVALAVGLSACGTDAAQDTTTPDTAQAEPMGMEMDMGDPAATPADAIEDASLSTGEFVALPTAPAGRTPSGEADLARHVAGTTVTLRLQGLPPDTAFIAHVHEGPCYEAGGPHYKHDPAGDDLPPNEIHLALTSDPGGIAMMTVENPQAADERARSVVIHIAGDDTPKLACADLDDVAR